LILVDEPRWPARGRLWSHLVSDVSYAELHAFAERHHLTFGPDPSTHSHNTLGGMLGNNSCGIHSVMAGETVQNVHELDVLTYDGERMTLGPTDDVAYATLLRRGGRAGEIHRELRALRDRHAPEIRRRFPDIPRRVSGYDHHRRRHDCGGR